MYGVFYWASGAQEKGSEYQWYRAASAASTDWIAISGAHSLTYTLTEEDENKFLKFSVVPKSDGAEPEGSITYSNVLRGAFAPTARKVTVKGKAVPGTAVQAEFTYEDLNGDAAGEHLWQWYYADTIDGAGKTAIPEATRSEYVLDESYEGKYLFVEVTPVSVCKPYRGKPALSGGSLISKDGHGDEGKAVVQDFQQEELGEYRVNIPNFPKPFTSTIEQEGSNRYLRLAMPVGSTGTPGYYLIPDPEYISEKITVTFRGRFKDFANADGGTGWPAHFLVRPKIYKDGVVANITSKMLIYVLDNGFLANYDSVVADGSDIAAGSYFYKGAVTDQWLTFRITFDKEDGKIFSEVFDESGELLGSAKTKEVMFTGEDQLADLMICAPYLNVEKARYGTVELDDVVTLYERIAKPPAVKPRADQVTISAERAETGGKVTAAYRYQDENDDPEDGSVYQWYRSTDEAGTEREVISGANELSYTLTEADENHYISFSVIPKNKAEEEATGEIAYSNVIPGAFAPTATDVTFDAGAIPGRTIHALFQYYDRNGDSEGTHLWKWYSAPTASGAEKTEIPGAVTNEFIVSADLVGRYLFAEVTPVSQRRPYQGTAVLSAGMQVSASNHAPKAEQLSLSGCQMAGERLNLSYSYFDEDGDAEKNSTYAWYLSDSENGEYELITSAVERSLPLLAEYDQQYIKASVTPKDAFGSAGEVVFSQPVQLKLRRYDEIHLSPDGDDTTGTGSMEAPFRTLEKARDMIRQWKEEGSVSSKGVTVLLHEGEYFLKNSFTLTEEDSGTVTAPILYQPYGNDKVRINGGRVLDVSRFTPISGEMKNRLRDPAARGKVLQAKLSDLGISQYEGIGIKHQAARYTLTAPLFELDGKKMALSRWPNGDSIEDWPKAHRVSYRETYSDPFFQETNARKFYVTAYFNSNIPSAWSYRLDQVIFVGYWRYAWAAEYAYGTVDPVNKTFTSRTSIHYGDTADVTNGREFRVFNVFEELDEPGEWYVDEDEEMMYFYPYEDTTANSRMVKTEGDFDLIVVDGASYVTFRGLDVTGGRQSGIVIKSGSNNLVSDCDIHLIQNTAVKVSGTNNGVDSSRMYHIGERASHLSGGDSESITSGRNYVSNCVMHDYSMAKEVHSSGVYLEGVGNRVSHNEIYNAPYFGIQFLGINHVMEYNILHDVCTNAADMGAIYTGRKLCDFGNVIRYNHFYNIGQSSTTTFSPCCVFTDDGSSELTVYGNICGPQVSHCEVFKVHGGMKNKFYNNILIDSERGIYVADKNDKQWLQWINNDTMAGLRASLIRAVNNPLQLELRPWLQDYVGLEEKKISSYTYHPNTYTNNVGFFFETQYDSSKWIRQLNGKLHDFYGIDQNMVVEGGAAEQELYFKDYANGDYTLTEAGYRKIRETLPEFKTIPFEAIGPKPTVNQAPVAMLASVGYDPKNDTTYSAVYQYRDPEGDPEGNSTVQWMVSSTPNWEDAAVIPGETGRTVELTALTYAGKYVGYRLTPCDQNGKSGRTVSSDLVPIAPNRSMLLDLIGAAEARKNAADPEVYSAEAIEQFATAIREARTKAEDTTVKPSEIRAAYRALEQAYLTFGGSLASIVSDAAVENGVLSLSLHNPEGVYNGSKVYTAVYRSDGTVAAAVSAVVNGQNLSVPLPREEGTFIKIFIWDENLQPIGAAKQVSYQK